jgi:TPR repeat protein
MRIHIAIVGLAAALLLGGCSYFGGGAKQTAAAPAATFDVLKMQRAQWRQLAEQGDAEGEYQLGMSYCCGFGPGHTDTIAYQWLCRAALQGHEQAQYQLGRMFGNGIKKRPFSTPQHADFAYMWYGLAAAQGDELAAGYLAALAQFMSPGQIARAREWEKHPASAVNCNSRLPFARL